MRWMASATIFFASRSAFRLRGLADLANLVRGVGLRLLLHAADQLVLRVLRRHAGHLLQPAALLADQLLELLPRASATVFSRRPKSLARLPSSLSRCSTSSNLRSSIALALADAALFLLDFFAPRPRISGSTFSRSLHQLFLAGDDRALAQTSPTSRSASPMMRLRRLLGGRLRGGLPLVRFRAPRRRPSAQKEKSRRGNDEHAKRGNNRDERSYEIYAPPRREPQDKENHCRPAQRRLKSLLERSAGEGRDVERANYKARLNLRVSLATPAKLRAGS